MVSIVLLCSSTKYPYSPWSFFYDPPPAPPPWKFRSRAYLVSPPPGISIFKKVASLFPCTMQNQKGVVFKFNTNHRCNWKDVQTAYLTFIIFALLFIVYKSEKYTFMLLKNIQYHYPEMFSQKFPLNVQIAFEYTTETGHI